MNFNMKVLLTAASILALCLPATNAICVSDQRHGYLPTNSSTNRALTFEACQQSCFNNQNCKMFYFDDSSLACYFTNDTANLIFDINKTSYAVLCVNCTVEATPGYLPISASKVSFPNSNMCEWQCATIPSCQVFYYDSATQMCYWSDNTTEVIPDNSKTSFIKHCPVNLCHFQQVQATDFISPQPFTTMDCEYFCSIFEDCLYFTNVSNECSFGVSMVNIVIGNSAASYIHYIKICTPDNNGYQIGSIKNGNNGKHFGETKNGNNGNHFGEIKNGNNGNHLGIIKNVNNENNRKF